MGKAAPNGIGTGFIKSSLGTELSKGEIFRMEIGRISNPESGTSSEGWISCSGTGWLCTLGLVNFCGQGLVGFQFLKCLGAGCISVDPVSGTGCSFTGPSYSPD